MSSAMIRGKTFLLIGLEERLASELEAVLNQLGGRVLRTLRRASDSAPEEADLVFCSAEPADYCRIIRLFKSRKMNVPVVVASRQAQASKWLDALEAGAADYCAPPFETASLSWILESSLLRAGRRPRSGPVVTSHRAAS